MGSIEPKGEDILQNLQPSFQEWENLYRTAIDFWRIQPWQWINDTDLFGVKNPEDGEIGYCCVVGALGEFLGLVVYLGTEGLESYLKIQGSESPEEDDLSTGKCLTASLEDRKTLQKPDLEVIKRLGLRFRGTKSWPLFRSYEPGYYPWYLNQRQVRFLTHALTQAADVTLRIKQSRVLLSGSEDGRYLVRVAEQNGPELQWRDEWLAPASLEGTKCGVPVPDELRLQRIKKRDVRQAGIWEIDFSLVPMPIQEGHRPFYPLCLLIVDQSSGFVLRSHLESKDLHGPEFQNQMLSAIEEISLLPQEIWVKRDEVFQLFEPLTSRLGLKMKRVKRLKEVELARRSMESYFHSGKMPR
jgi:hypothetical protein